MTACTFGQKRIEVKKEIWLIDNMNKNDIVLYRLLNNGQEQVIPIMSSDIDKFMCMDYREVNKLIDAGIIK